MRDMQERGRINVAAHESGMACELMKGYLATISAYK
jgi:hypothetical protein